MIIRPALLPLVATLLLAGCAADIARDKADKPPSTMSAAAGSKLVLNVCAPPALLAAKDWADFRQEWQDNFAEQAASAGLAFEMQDGAARPTGEPGTLVAAWVTDYRFVSPGRRWAIGVFSGNASLESKLSFSDLRTGDPLGSETANTSSSFMQGVFSPMTNRQVEAIAKDVVRRIKPSAASASAPPSPAR